MTVKTLFTSSPTLLLHQLIKHQLTTALVVFIARVKPPQDLEDYCMRIIHGEIHKDRKTCLHTTFGKYRQFILTKLEFIVPCSCLSKRSLFVGFRHPANEYNEYRFSKRD